MAARLMAKGSATSVTAMSSSSSMARIARRVGSARGGKDSVQSVGHRRTILCPSAIVNLEVEYGKARGRGDPARSPGSNRNDSNALTSDLHP